MAAIQQDGRGRLIGINALVPVAGGAWEASCNKSRVRCKEEEVESSLPHQRLGLEGAPYWPCQPSSMEAASSFMG